MDYKTILDMEKAKLRSELKWWPNFVYHFTDVHNASQMLHSGWIYSRSIMEDKNTAISENASLAVIEATIPENKTYGRLYFRPLTPTQYHNEGYKPVDIREYRHSEVVREGGFPVEPLLRVILCRTQAERETLLYLIKQYSLRMYNTYKDKIYYKTQYKIFFNNGIFIKLVKVDNSILSVILNDPEQRLRKDDTIVSLSISIELWYKKFDGMIMSTSFGSSQVEYNKIRRLEMKLLSDIDFDVLKVCIRFDESIMYENEICVEHEIF